MRFSGTASGGSSSGDGIPPKGGSDHGEEGRHSGDSYTEPLGREHYHQIEAVLGYQFKDRSWLERALTHRSIHAKSNSKNDYERLEFLGDAVLDLAVAHLLLDTYPEAREGELSKMRAALVNTQSLADAARSLGLGPYIRLSRGELVSGGAERASTLADVFEALIGAIYREAGFEVALACVQGQLGLKLKTVTPTDPKTELQEVLHAQGKEAPEYLLEIVEGPEHAPTFVSVVKIDGKFVGRGRGATKKASQQHAAAEALAIIASSPAVPSSAIGNSNGIGTGAATVKDTTVVKSEAEKSDTAKVATAPIGEPTE